MRRLAVFIVFATIVVFSGPIALAGSAPKDCEVRVGGKPFRNGSHITLPSDEDTTIAVTALDEKPRYRVELELAGVTSKVGSGVGKEFGWRRKLNVSDYANYGVGTYGLRVITIVDDEPCIASGHIDITGRAPITTAAGGASVGIAIIGAGLLLVSLTRRGGRRLQTRHPFSAEDTLGQFIAVEAPGDYVGWAEVACDLGARTFVTTKPDADAVRAFVAETTTRERLAEVRVRGVRVKADERDHPLPRLRWRPRPFVIVPLLAALGGVAVVVYLQQAAITELTRSRIAIAAGAGLLLGLLVTNLSRLLGVAALNRRLARAEAGLDEEEVEPRYPPIDHLDGLDTFVWTPTHTIPDVGDGQPAWEEADKSKASVANLDPGLPVRVIEQRDGLAQVVCSNGWVGWTEAEPLQEIDA